MTWKLACLLLIPLCWSLVTVGGTKASAKSSKEWAAIRRMQPSTAVSSRVQPPSPSVKNSRIKLPASVKNTQNTMTQRKTIFQILTDKSLWGKDFLSVLVHLQSFQQAGERQIAVFAEKVVTTTPLKSEAEAKRVAEKLQQAISETNARPTPLTQKLMQLNEGQREALKPEVLRYFPDDESVRVKVNSLDLFSAKLAVETVRKQLGQPEKVSTVIIPTEGERREQILTLYSYAGGAIVFVEADIAPRPGRVNRVLLDVPRIIVALEKEVK